ncbi:MAG: helix-turn-helix transcriptional regulator [Cyanobacteria bacterium P01_G01_bin.39]
MTRPKKHQHQETNSPFKRLRLSVKLSQEQLAREIGVAVSTIRRWEKGQAEPTMTVAQMKEFCKAVHKSFEDLPNSLLPNDSSKSGTNGCA